MVREVVKATGDIITVAGDGTSGYTRRRRAGDRRQTGLARGRRGRRRGRPVHRRQGNNVIREVIKATGDIITVAGDGTAGYSGDSGPGHRRRAGRPRRHRGRRRGRPVHRRRGQQRDPRGRQRQRATSPPFAGNGTEGYSGDGGPATAAEARRSCRRRRGRRGRPVHRRHGQQRDPRGHHGDAATSSPSPATGRGGYSGDGGPATAAELDRPDGVAVDAAGDLFIADEYNNVIREVVEATGDIITVAGNGVRRLQRRRRAGHRRRAGRSHRRRRGRRGGPVHRRLGQRRHSRDHAGRDHHLKYATATALIASTAAAAQGQSVTFTATVSDLSPGGAMPSGGTVTFSDQFGTLASKPLSSGVATLTTTSLALGTYNVTAAYSGTTGLAPSTTGTIVTAAGNGTEGFRGDNGPATAAEFQFINGVAVDAAGDVFIADSDNNVIREVVKATGDIITVAGNKYGYGGYSGDNGPATAAELASPGVSPSTPRATSSLPTHLTTLFARSSRRPATSSPSPATVRAVSVTLATAGRRPPPSWTSPLASPSTPRATSSLPTHLTTRFARSSRRPATSSTSQATVAKITPEITGPRPLPSWTPPMVSLWTPRATCSSPTMRTT